MDPEYLQRKYNRFLKLVRRMRKYQVDYIRYRATSDRINAQRLQGEVDRFILEEEKKQNSKQGELL